MIRSFRSFRILAVVYKHIIAFIMLCHQQVGGSGIRVPRNIYLFILALDIRAKRSGLHCLRQQTFIGIFINILYCIRLFSSSSKPHDKGLLRFLSLLSSTENRVVQRIRLIPLQALLRVARSCRSFRNIIFCQSIFSIDIPFSSRCSVICISDDLL